MIRGLVSARYAAARWASRWPLGRRRRWSSPRGDPDDAAAGKGHHRDTMAVGHRGDKAGPDVGGRRPPAIASRPSCAPPPDRSAGPTGPAAVSRGLPPGHPPRRVGPRVHHRHGRRRPPDRVGPRLPRLADLRQPSGGGALAVPRRGRVRQPDRHRHRLRRRDPGRARIEDQDAPAPGSHRAVVGPGDRRAGPDRPRRRSGQAPVGPAVRDGPLPRVDAVCWPTPSSSTTGRRSPTAG